MNRHQLLYFFLFIPFATRGQAKVDANIEKDVVRLKCFYRLTFQPDSTNARSVQTEKTFLLVGNSMSRFQTQNSFLRDSMTFALLKGPTLSLNLSQFPKSKFNYVIYKKGAEITTFDNIYTTKYKYVESISFKWVITPEKKDVNGFACQRATTIFAGRTYNAWFTKEVPVSEGPYKFHGLPGLIVKISDNRNQYVFELISVAKPKVTTEFTHPQTMPGKSIVLTTKKTFTTGLRNFQANAIDIMAQQGSSYGDVETQKKQYKETMKARNNPIELTNE